MRTLRIGQPQNPGLNQQMLIARCGTMINNACATNATHARQECSKPLRLNGSSLPSSTLPSLYSSTSSTVLGAVLCGITGTIISIAVVIITGGHIAKMIWQNDVFVSVSWLFPLMQLFFFFF